MKSRMTTKVATMGSRPRSCASVGGGESFLDSLSVMGLLAPATSVSCSPASTALWLGCPASFDQEVARLDRGAQGGGKLLQGAEGSAPRAAPLLVRDELDLSADLAAAIRAD